MKSKIFISIIIIAIIAIAGLFFFKEKIPVDTPTSLTTELENYVQFNDKKISLLISDTPDEREKGLGGMSELPDNTAMLFVFDVPDLYGIWMEDMKFPIDIIWLNEEKEIIHLEENISPETYPDVFYPPSEALYVLETKAGFVKENSLAIDSILNIITK